MIVRRHLTANFTIMPNAVWNDDALSIEGKGTLGYLLSRPDDWKVNLKDLQRRLGLGKNRAQAVVKQLMDAGYMVRLKQKRLSEHQFGTLDYIVFDSPETMADYMAKKGESRPQPENEATAQIDNEGRPQPQNGATAFPEKSDGRNKAAAPIPVAPKQGSILSTESTKSKAQKVSAEAGADAPSVSAMIWEEGKVVLSQAPSNPNPSVIGKWLQRVTSDADKRKLLGMIRAAVKAGTGDPISYVSAALAKEFPPLPDAKTFDDAHWAIIQKAVISKRNWSSAWGPAPGKKGCNMPAHLITSQLTAALNGRAHA